MPQSAFTCITCHVAFVNADIQRHHYKSDWHRYNLKRKVVGLPPVTVDDFQKRAADQKALEKSNQSLKNIEGILCKVCNRKFTSFNTHKNHLISKRHKNAENKELEILKEKLLQQSETHIENYMSDEEREEKERQAYEKALIEAKNNMKQPVVIRADEQATKRKKDPDDNPRLRWYQKQVKEIGGSQTESNVDDDEEWEELSDAGEETVIIGDCDLPETESQIESTCTEEPINDVMSRVKIESDVESLGSSVGTPQVLLGPCSCLFCHDSFDCVETNVTHMSRKHGFFIPELAYLIDLEGLLAYLGEKVGMGNVCLWCNEKGPAFYSLKAVRHHMKAKGHCKMLTEGDSALEYADFYDFRSSYPDDCGSDEEIDDDELSIVSSFGKPAFQPDSEHDMELVLPSGARIGHRSLMRYYKQHFPTVDRYKNQRKTVIDRLMNRYKAIGWHGETGVAMVKQTQRDLRHVQKMKSKYLQKLGVKNNKTMTKHFRPSIMF